MPLPSERSEEWWELRAEFAQHGLAECDSLTDRIEQLIETKIADAIDMLNDRIQDVLGVRP